MNEFLCKTFVKDHDNVTDAGVRQSYGKFAGIVGILSNVLLCAAKIITGIIAGSIAIIADGVNNLADASSSLITLVGFKLASMPEDEEHPYGHARYEYITGMIVSILIIVVGGELLKSSVDKILHPSPLEFSWTVCGILVLAILIKIWQARFNIFVGKKIQSLTLAATGADSRNDVIATSALLVSLLAGRWLDLQIDGWMGVLVALFIIWSGISLVRETMSPLLGEAPDPALIDQISHMALEPAGVLGIHDLVVHNYGPGKIFASIHIEVDADGDLMESHDMVDNIERHIASALGIEITAHLDPIRVNDPLIRKLNSIASATIKGMAGVSHVHDLRAVTGPTHTNVIFDIMVEPDCLLTGKEIHQAFTKAIQAEYPNFYVVINFDKPYFKQHED